MGYDDRAAIDARVKALLVERLQVATDAGYIDDAATLTDLGLDSTAILSLVVGLEDTFGIEIPDREISPDNFGRVDDISRYVASRLDRIDR
ncbi:MAG: acyl carrier protein [Acidimicrobiales bacterium]